MRLLNTSSLILESFLGDEKPPYAILSHTWEPEGEFLFDDLMRTPREDYPSRPGYPKVKNTCHRALQDGHQYVWIDTCCIDKNSSAELSEAINSMFRWYEDSRICYAFLSDVADGKATFVKSRWFSRGWTLQELIAPNQVNFMNASWQDLDDRVTLADQITTTTGIDRKILARNHRQASYALYDFSIAQRMKWASKRHKSRTEDSAYCLMGLFDVNMPLLYGEGNRAFRRLQEVIINESADHSILAFRSLVSSFRSSWTFSAVLAPYISYFCEDILQEWASNYEPQRMQNGNISLVAHVAKLETAQEGIVHPCAPSHIAFLDCMFEDDYVSRPAILLKQVSSGVYKRCSEGSYPMLLIASSNSQGQYARILGRKHPFPIPNSVLTVKKRITIEAGIGVNRTSQGSACPIIMDLSSLESYCTIGPSHPTPRTSEWRLTAFDFIGVVTLKYEEEVFFVFWGSNPGPWSCIQNLESVRNSFAGWVGSNLDHDEAADAIVQYMKEHEANIHDLMGIFSTFPSVWGPSEKRGAPPVSVGLLDRLVLRRSYTLIMFVGREVPQMQVIANMLRKERTLSSPRAPRAARPTTKEDMIVARRASSSQSKDTVSWTRY